MDVAASWQFMVDSFSEAFFQSRRILAADWRGYGLTTGPATDSYRLKEDVLAMPLGLGHTEYGRYA